MDDIKCRVAIATSDGIVVNSHFGKARKFYIYELEDEELSFVEIREFPPACEVGGHDNNKLEENAKRISDCDYLLVSRIGDEAARVVESFGVGVYELPGIIEKSIKQLVAYVKLQELFK